MKIIRKAGFILLVIISLIMVVLLFWREDIPDGRLGARAEQLADSMAMAMGQDAWENLQWISWKVNDRRSYIWHKPEDLAIIRFGDYRVHLNLNSLIGSAWQNGEILDGVKKDQAILKAWSKWCFDSFLLNPVAKIRDEGTVRKYVEHSDGSSGLLVTFTKGGETPGDSYLFELNDAWLPQRASMWVRKIPVGGLDLTFEDYIEPGKGIHIASAHRIGPVSFAIHDLTIGDSFTDLGFKQNPFLFVE